MILPVDQFALPILLRHLTLLNYSGLEPLMAGPDFYTSMVSKV